MIEWSASYDVGYEKIDTQHKRLIAIMNEIIDCIHEGSDPADMLAAFYGLVDYTKTHLVMEETLMTRYKYPDAALHRQLHSALIEGVDKLLAEHKAGTKLLGIKAVMFVRDWLINHIQKADKNSASFCRHGNSRRRESTLAAPRTFAAQDPIANLS